MTPLRFTILQFSQSFFTDALTFINSFHHSLAAMMLPFDKS